MKKALVIAIAWLVAVPALAQHDGQRRPSREKAHPQITELVSDLSSGQKRKLEAIHRDSQERLNPMRKQLQSVRDSIRLYMDMDNNQTAKIYPLFDREAELQRNISREMYSTKLRVDEVLTPSQREELRKVRENNHRTKSGTNRN